MPKSATERSRERRERIRAEKAAAREAAAARAETTATYRGKRPETMQELTDLLAAIACGEIDAATGQVQALKELRETWLKTRPPEKDPVLEGIINDLKDWSGRKLENAEEPTPTSATPASPEPSNGSAPPDTTSGTTPGTGGRTNPDLAFVRGNVVGPISRPAATPAASPATGTSEVPWYEREKYGGEPEQELGPDPRIRKRRGEWNRPEGRPLRRDRREGTM